MRSPELISLAKRINDREETIQVIKGRAVTMVNHSLVEVLLQGQDLIEVKARCAHGSWKSWLRVNCPTIHLRSAQRYMALATKAPKVPELTEADSLRSALALCEMEGREEKKETQRWPAYIEATGRLSKLCGYIECNPLDRWPVEGLDKFRSVLQPIVERLWPDKFGARRGLSPTH